MRKLPQKNTGCYRLFMLLKRRKVSCLDCKELGIAGSALPRRKKDLEKRYGCKINIEPKKIRSKFTGKMITISQYKLVSV